MTPRVVWALVTIACVQASGCSTFRSYETELSETSQQLGSGNVEGALALLEKNNSSADKDLLYYFEKGELLRAKGDLTGSQVAWREADQVIYAWEEAVKADPNKYLGEVGSFLINDKVRRYEGYDYEKVMLTTQMALNDVALHDFDSARTEIKKTHEREALIAELRDKQYLDQEQEAEEQGVTTEYKDLQGYPVEALNDPEVTGLKNSYQSAFSHYLSGFVYEALGEKGLAAPGYRKAIELRPDTPLLEQALLNLDRPIKGKKIADSDVLLVVQTGLAPARNSLRIPLPIPTNDGLIIAPLSFPLMTPDTSTPSFSSVELDGRTLELTELSSIDAMSRRALRDDMPGIILRTTLRAATRAVAQKQLNEENPWAGLALGIASAITEGADERTWRTLPDNIQVARLNLSKGTHRLSLPAVYGVTEVEITIKDKFQVIPLRVVGTQVFASGNATRVTPPVVGQALADAAQP
ncbi:MAG: hypothetical protein ABWY06_14990 [Pseudomonas sp.]|uniref:COG3014 family protein n=1 Tax=Pseudomonas sp. TaxID=306 RepID=UPI00339A1D09